MKPENAKTMYPTCDLTLHNLEEAAKLLPLSTFYKVTSLLTNIYYLSRELTIPSALAPVILMNVDESFGADEWTLESNGEIFWSPGALG